MIFVYPIYKSRAHLCALQKRPTFNTLLSQKRYVEHIIWKRIFRSSDQSQEELILKIYRCRSSFRDIIDISLSNLQIARPSMRVTKKDPHLILYYLKNDMLNISFGNVSSVVRINRNKS